MDGALPSLLPPRFADWFASRGWAAREHQLAMIDRARQGRDALLIAPTGGGKTLAGFLPSLIEHHCSPGVRGGFLQRVLEGTYAAHIVEHTTLELQNLAGMRTGFGKARQRCRPAASAAGPDRPSGSLAHSRGHDQQGLQPDFNRQVPLRRGPPPLPPLAPGRGRG